MSDVWLSILLVVVFVLIGGVFSGAEIALVSLRESQVRAMAERGRRGQAVQKLVTVAISYLSLVAGELTPKRLALQRAEGFALLVAAPLNAIAKLSRPVIWLLSKSTNVLVRLFGGNPNQSAGRSSATRSWN